MTRRRLIVVAALLWLLPAAHLAARLWGFAIDDFFITDRYAWNLVHGHGFVFNPGERVFGTTAPGMGLLLAGLSVATGLDVPEAGSVTTALAVWALAVLLLVEGARRGRGPEALAAGSYVIVCPFVWVHAGSEAPLIVTVLAAAAVLVERRPGVAGALAGAAVWLRPDSGLGVALLGLLAWRERRRLPWAYGLAGAAVIAAGMAAAWLWFGDLLPATLEAKRVHAAALPDVFPSGLRYWTSALRQLGSGFLTDQVLVFAALGLAGHLALVAWGGRAGRLLALYSLALVVVYPLLRVPCYGWYLVPTVVAAIYGIAELAGRAARATSAFFGRTWAGRAAAAAAVVLLVTPIGSELLPGAWRLLVAPRTAPRYELYRDAGLWLRANTSEDDRAAYVEVGTIAYFSRRPMDDLLALVTPRSLPYVAAGDLAGAFLARPPEIFVYSPPLARFLDPIREAPWFADAYAEAARFEHPVAPDPLILYRRVPGSELPPPSPPPSPHPILPASPTPPDTPPRRTATPPSADSSTTVEPAGGGAAPAPTS